MRQRIRDSAICLVLGTVLGMYLNWIFYASIWGLFLLPLTIAIVGYGYGKIRQQKEEKEKQKEFQEMLEALVLYLRAGSSFERAIKEVKQSLLAIKGKDSNMVGSLEQIIGLTEMNVSMEEAMFRFAYESKVEEIITFAEVFRFGKRAGGDFIFVMENTAVQIREKIAVEQDIAVLLAGKKLEQKLLSMIPLCLLGFIKITSPDFLQPLYHNFGGAIMMTLVLMGYVFSIFLSIKIMEIKI